MSTSAKYQCTGPGATKGDSAPTSRLARSTQAINTTTCRQIIDHNATPMLFSSKTSALVFNMPPIEGMVDLHTLYRIYAQLEQSHFSDDNNLAVWIQDNYLPDNCNDKTEGGLPITDVEGFTKLYNAYKRVRVLTGRVQDRWPFFDRRWKEINKNLVIKIAAGVDTTTPSGTSARTLLETYSMGDTAENGLESTMVTATRPRTNVASTSLDQTAVSHSKEPPTKGNTALEVTQELSISTASAKASKASSLPAIDRSATPPRSTDGENMAGNMSAGSSPGSALAAEAEPERASLDDLLTSSQEKRKRSPDLDANGCFAADHRGYNKRQRGIGKGGRDRGRKNKFLTVEHADLDNDVTDHTPSTFEDVVSHPDTDTEMVDAPVKKLKGVERPKAEPSSPRMTRRQKHLSGGNDAQNPSSQDSSARATSQKTSTRKRRADSDATAVDEHTTTTIPANEGVAMPDKDSTTTEPTEADLLDLGMAHFAGAQSSATALAEKERDTDGFDSAAIDKAKTNDPEVKTQEPGTVEIFARVNTGTTSFDVSLPGTSIFDKKLKTDLLGYAAWKEKAGKKSKNVDFETWCSIYSFDR